MTTITLLAATSFLPALIHVLLAVLVGVILMYAVSLFVADGRILTVIKLIIGLLVLIYSLQLFGVSL